MKLTIRYAHVSVALDIAAAGIGALGGPLNAMTAVIGKRGLEGAIRQSARRIATWRRPTLWQPAPEPEILSPGGQEPDESRGFQPPRALRPWLLALPPDDLAVL